MEKAASDIQTYMGDNIKMDLKDALCECVDWIQLALSRYRWRVFVSKEINLRIE
jgi:hypothetical protein